MSSSTHPTILPASAVLIILAKCKMPPAMKYQTLELACSGKRIVGESGRCYVVDQVLQEKGNPPRHVYLASAGNKKFILKNVPPAQFEYIRAVYSRIRNNQYLRISEDAIPEHSIFVYRYFADHLLSFAQKEVPVLLRKRILKDALRGLAALHEQNIVHTDVKPNNILFDWQNGKHGIAINQVQLADIEDATYVDLGSDIVGIQVGNLMWRSPEAHTQGRVNKPSDIFSFGIVCIYAITKQVIFAVEEEDLEAGEEPLAVILERQISYFADEEGFDAMLKHLGDSPWCQVLEVLHDGFGKNNPRKPVALWKGIDEDFKDLIVGLTKFDPAQRLTASEALKQSWFREVEQDDVVIATNEHYNYSPKQHGL